MIEENIFSIGGESSKTTCVRCGYTYPPSVEFHQCSKKNMIEINILNSSNLKSASYDEATKIMIVNFQNGTSYRYADVPEELWNRFEKTVNENGSAGKFFHANIRTLPCEKVEE